MSHTSKHLSAFSAMLATDPVIRNLNGRHLQLLAFICEDPGPHTVGGLAVLMRLSAPHISRAAERLETLGLITRTGDTHDKRYRLIRSTQQGRDVINALARYFAAAA